MVWHSKSFGVSLINLPTDAALSITANLTKENLCSFDVFNVNNISEINAELGSDLVIIYINQPEALLTDILNLSRLSPVVVICDVFDYELERNARKHGVELLLALNDQELCDKVYGFVKTCFLIQAHQALVVDDSNVDGFQIKAILEKQHITTHYCDTPTLVYDYLINNPQITILMLDFEMPSLNGIQLFKQIKSQLEDRNLIVMGCTSSSEGIIRFLDAGVDECFSKPLEPELFAVKLKRVLFRHHTQIHQKQTSQDYIDIIENVNKEVRNPVYILYTLFDQLLKKQKQHSDYLESKRLGQLAFDRLNDLFEDMSMFVQLNAHQNEVALKEASLDSLIASQLFLESHQAQLKNIIINRDVESGLLAQCDQTKLERVIGDLTSRAVKDANPGSELNVRLYSENGRIVFEIADQNEETLGNKKNLEGKNTPNLNLEMGLNLINCKSIVERHGGHLGVKKSESGNTYYFTLPENGHGKIKH